ncbi:hypothetical protein Tco_1167303, partial [Tanacetum coccineum]
EFSALEFKEFSLSLRVLLEFSPKFSLVWTSFHVCLFHDDWQNVFVVLIAEVLDVHSGCGIRRFFFIYSFYDGGHNGSCVSHHAHSNENGYSDVEHLILVPSEFVERLCTREQTPLILSWERIPRLDSGMREVPANIIMSLLQRWSSGVILDGAFGRVGDEEVVVGEGVVVTSLSLDMLTNSCLGGIMVSLVFLEGLKEEALVEFMVEWFKEDEDGKKNGKDDLFN